MPLPMPRWVMSSPIHISSAVPAVRVSTTSMMRGRLKFWSPPNRSMPVVLLHPAEAAAAVVEQEGEAGRLHERDGDREVAGPLGDLALADRALLLPLLELGDHHREDLHDDRDVMYGMIPSANTANWVSAPPENSWRKPSTPPFFGLRPAAA